jgi:hypothetical protein
VTRLIYFYTVKASWNRTLLLQVNGKTLKLFAFFLRIILKYSLSLLHNKRNEKCFLLACLSDCSSHILSFVLTVLKCRNSLSNQYFMNNFAVKQAYYKGKLFGSDI